VIYVVTFHWWYSARSDLEPDSLQNLFIILEWDELQAQVQQIEHVKWPLLVCLASKVLLGIIGILT